MKMKLKKQMKRSVVFLLALLLAAASSLAVYAAVSYDSSKDPVVSLSGMTAFVDDALRDIRAAISSLETRMTLLELTGGGSGGSSGGTGVGSAQLAEILRRIEELEKEIGDLQSENNSLKNDLKTTKNELQGLYDELAKEVEDLRTTVSSLSTDIKNLQNQITSTKNDLLTLEKNFKQISDISTKLATVTQKVNNLTSSSGDITKLKNQVKDLQTQMNGILGELGQVYKPVFVPYGATIIAKDSDDTVLLILRSGSASAVSPFVTEGKLQGLNDLTLGNDIYNGEAIPLFHHIMIPRGGDDGRGVTVTSVDGAYFLLGGDYTIVEK